MARALDVAPPGQRIFTLTTHGQSPTELAATIDKILQAGRKPDGKSAPSPDGVSVVVPVDGARLLAVVATRRRLSSPRRAAPSAHRSAALRRRRGGRRLAGARHLFGQHQRRGAGGDARSRWGSPGARRPKARPRRCFACRSEVLHRRRQSRQRAGGVRRRRRHSHGARPGDAARRAAAARLRRGHHPRSVGRQDAQFRAWRSPTPAGDGGSTSGIVDERLTPV